MELQEAGRLRELAATTTTITIITTISISSIT
jgi:hypothetical protein